MVVEANKDEALLCLQKAKEAMLARDFSKMKKFIAKAKRLDPNCDASCEFVEFHISISSLPFQHFSQAKVRQTVRLNPIDRIVEALKEVILMMITMKILISGKEDDLRKALLLETPLATRRLVEIDRDLGVLVELRNIAKRTEYLLKGKFARLLF